MNEIVPQKINTLEDVSNTLLSLQNNVSESVKQVISAQLHLIQVIQTPSLAGKAIDTLILHLKLSLDNAHSHQEKEAIRTNFALVVQELHMFLELQSQWEMDQWANSGRDLLDATVKLVVNVTKQIISFAKNAVCIGLDAVIGVAQIERGADPLPIIGNLASDIKRSLKKQAPEQPTGFFSKLGRWLVSDSAMEQIKANHIMTIDNMTKKLVKYRKLIGPSIVIAGVVEDNISEISQWNEERFATFGDLFKVSNDGITVYITTVLGCFILSLVVSLFRLGCDNDGWFGRQMLFTLFVAILMGVIWFPITNKDVIESLIVKRKNRRYLKRLRKKARFFDVLS